jgi:uncharacterized protein with HEPN domain
MSIDNIEQDIGEIKLYENFLKSRTTKQATERNFEIIGEAVNKMLKNHPEIKITSTKQIVGLRNRLIHAYDSVDAANLWAIIINHLPLLKTEITNLL